MDYGLTATVVGAFTLLFSFLLFYLAGRVNRASVAFLSVGFFFLGLTLLTIPVIIVDTLEYGNEPPCEWHKNHSDALHIYGNNFSGEHWTAGSDPEDASPTPGPPGSGGPGDSYANYTLFHTNTSFHWVNSCSERSVPGTITAIFTIFTWLVWAALFAGLLAAIIYFIRSWVKKV